MSTNFHAEAKEFVMLSIMYVSMYSRTSSSACLGTAWGLLGDWRTSLYNNFS